MHDGVILDVDLDCCDSAAGTREELVYGEERMVPRFLRPPVDIECRVEDDLPVRKLLRGD